MTINNPFHGAGSGDLSALRRAINSALTAIVGQANTDIRRVDAKFDPFVLPTVSSLPSAGTAGRLVYLTATDGSNTVGVYVDSGTAWSQL